MDRAVGRKRICPMFSGLLTLVSSIPSASSHGSNHGSPCLGAPFPGLGGDSCLCMGLLSCVYMLQNLFLPSPSLCAGACQPPQVPGLYPPLCSLAPGEAPPLGRRLASLGLAAAFSSPEGPSPATLPGTLCPVSETADSHDLFILQWEGKSHTSCNDTACRSLINS